jgi:hypothetical protein
MLQIPFTYLYDFLELSTGAGEEEIIEAELATFAAGAFNTPAFINRPLISLLKCQRTNSTKPRARYFSILLFFFLFLCKKISPCYAVGLTMLTI